MGRKAQAWFGHEAAMTHSQLSGEADQDEAIPDGRRLPVLPGVMGLGIVESTP